jgi:hypothetical protein
MNARIYATVAGVSLAAVLAVSMVVTPAFAARSIITDETRDATDANFDITQVTVNGQGSIMMTVAGTAGGTTPSDESQSLLVYAYVFVTDKGIYAVTSHQAEDSNQVENDLEWHTHLVTLDGSNCVTSIQDAANAVVVGHNIILTQTGASEVAAALTAELTITPEPFSVCVTDVFDSASPA